MSIDLSSPEAKEAIKAAIEEATSGLAAKNRELLAELKEARKGRQVNPEDMEKLENELDRLRGELSEAQKAAKKATSEVEATRKQLQDAEGFTQRLLVDNGLTDALAKAGVTNPVHMKAVKSMLAGQVQVVAEGDAKIAKVGDKALADFVSEWAKGDEGKFFVAAPMNTGGGATGGGSGPNTKLPETVGKAKTKEEKIALIEARLKQASAS